VVCPAAPLLRAWLAEEMPEAQVGLGDVTVPRGAGEGSLICVTYLDRDGGLHGLASPAGDRWVRGWMRRWPAGSAMRSRRLLVSGPAGLPGYRRAAG